MPKHFLIRSRIRAQIPVRLMLRSNCYFSINFTYRSVHSNRELRIYVSCLRFFYASCLKFMHRTLPRLLYERTLALNVHSIALLQVQRSMVIVGKFAFRGWWTDERVDRHLSVQTCIKGSFHPLSPFVRPSPLSMNRARGPKHKWYVRSCSRRITLIHRTFRPSTINVV